MAADTSQNRTEQATPRRLEESRKKGQIPVSAELNSGLHLLVGSVMLWLLGTHIGPSILGTFRDWVPRIADVEGSPGDIQRWLTMLAVGVFTISGAMIGVLFAAGLLVGLIQSGFNISFEPLNADWSKLSPISGFQKIFSTRAVAKGAAALLKLAAVSAIVGWILYSRSDAIASSGFMTLGGTLTSGWEIAIHMMLAVAVALVVIGGFDYLFQRWKHGQDLMMSRQEIKEEFKETEGDPELKGRLRTLQRELAQRQSDEEVPTADVIVTNPTHLSIALKYDRDTMAAPKVVAKGAGAAALRIRKIAAKHNVPIVERKPVARALYQMAEIGDEIPVELFQAVAEILIYVYNLKRAS